MLGRWFPFVVDLCLYVLALGPIRGLLGSGGKGHHMLSAYTELGIGVLVYILAKIEGREILKLYHQQNSEPLGERTILSGPDRVDWPSHQKYRCPFLPFHEGVRNPRQYSLSREAPSSARLSLSRPRRKLADGDDGPKEACSI